MNKSVVLKDYNGDVCYPKVNKNNIIGYPYRPRGDVKIFFGFGGPSSNALNYKNIKADDLYFDMNLNGKFGIYYRCVQIDNNNIRWDYYCDYILSDRDPITGNIANWYAYNKILPFYKAGLIWCNTTTGELFLSKPIEVGNIPSWTNLTDTYSKSEVNSFISNINNIYNKMDRIEDTIAGSVITLVDSSNRNIPSINIMGKSTQTKTNGYQLAEWCINGNTYSHGGITWTYLGNGRIKVEGTNTSPYNETLILLDDTDGATLPRGQYIYQAKGVSAKCIVGVYNTTPLSADGTVNVDASVEGQAYTFYARVEQGAKVNTILELQYEKGSVAHDCEDYTGGQPSPSINYPKDIEDITSENIDIFKKNIVPLNELSGKNYTKLRCEYNYDSTTNEMVLVSGEFEDTKEIYFSSYSMTSGNDYTNNLNKSYVIPVTEGMQLKRILKNNVFDTFIPTFASADKKVITGFQGNFNTSPYIVTVPQGAKYMTIRTGVKNAQPNTEYRDNVMICVVGTDETYEEPMIPQTATLTKTLRGIPVESGGNYTDNNGQQWICDTIERYKDGTGKLIQRIARANTDVRAQITKQTSSKNNIYNIRWNHANTPTAPKPIYDFYAISNIKIESFLFKTNQQINTGEEGAAIFSNGSTSWILKCGCTLNKFPTLEDFTTWVNNNPFDIVYAIDTPIETPLTAEELAELDLSTYKPVTNIISNTDIEVTYVADTKNWIDNKCEQLQNAILSQGGNV